MATAANSGHLSTTVLLGKGLTPGKLRGLQRISNPNGTLTMVALDQNSSMIEMATKALKTKGQDREPTYEEIVEAKVDLAKQLAPGASGVLIDAYYGAWSCVASGAIPPHTGLLVRVEMSGSPKNKVGAPMGLIEPGWSVAKIKLMGADAVKLLAQFEPTEPISAEHQFHFIEHIYDECKKHDILLLLETVAFPFGGEKKTDPKLPGAEGRDGDRVGPPAQPVLRHLQGRVPRPLRPGVRRPAPRQPPGPRRGQRTPLGAALGRRRLPGLLQAGRMAMEAGASGVLGGRAFWKEYFLQDGDAARSQFAATTALKRVADVNTVVREHGTPWFSRYGLTTEDLSHIRAARAGTPGTAPPSARRPTAPPARRPPARCIKKSGFARRKEDAESAEKTIDVNSNFCLRAFARILSRYKNSILLLCVTFASLRETLKY